MQITAHLVFSWLKYLLIDFTRVQFLHFQIKLER